MTIKLKTITGFNPDDTKQTSGHITHLNTKYHTQDMLFHFGVTKVNKYPGEKGKHASELEAGYSALDTALEAYISLKQIPEPTKTQETQIKYYADVVCELQRNKCPLSKKNTPTFRSLSAQIQRDSYGLKEPIKTKEEFERLLKDINARPLASLKQKKIEAYNCLKGSKMPLKDLQEIQSKLAIEKPDEPYRFMNQLRSRLYIIKYLRGFYDHGTHTRYMNRWLSSEIIKLKGTSTEEFKIKFLESTQNESIILPPANLNKGNSTQ